VTGRIRTVKPDFFKHEGLHELGVRSGFGPLIRVAYAGLWCQADREGRFRWRPNILRNEISPWDDVDFESLLEELRAAGYIVRYEVGGESYGFIPTFPKHQRPNHREAESQLPPPPGHEPAAGAEERPGMPGQAQASPGTPGGKGTGTGREGNRELEVEGEPSPPARDGGGSSSQPRRRSSLEWDQSVDLMRRMGFDEDTIERVERCSLDAIDLYRLVRDVHDNRRVKNKAAYLVGAIKAIERGEETR